MDTIPPTLPTDTAVSVSSTSSSLSSSTIGTTSRVVSSSSSSSTAAFYRTRLNQSGATGSEVRSLCRNDTFTDHTSGLAPGYAQANIVILPFAYAYDFLLFCTRNPVPCPLLEVTDKGSPFLKYMAKDADLRTDIPKYIILRNGIKEEVTNIRSLWSVPSLDDSIIKQNTDTIDHHAISDARNDWVGFLLGCSFSFEEALLARRLPVRHLQQNKEEESLELSSSSPTSESSTSSTVTAPVVSASLLRNRATDGLIVPQPRNVPMYRTTIPNIPAGIFGGNLVVSMRPMTVEQANEAVRITSFYPRVHGKPIHIGDPSLIGIQNIHQPDYGDAVILLEDEVPVFWACGVTPLAALTEAGLPIAITHAPGHMLVLDILNKDLADDNKYNGIDITQRTNTLNSKV